MAAAQLKSRSQITLTLDKEVKEYLEKRSAETDVPISRYIDRLVRKDMVYKKENSDE
jgi:hypothetical protein